MSGSTGSTAIGRGYVLLVVGLAVVAGALVAVGAVAAGTGADPATHAMMQEDGDDVEYVSEEEFVEPAPEEGDSYFEMEDPDGNWISYVNPRDEYRMPYLGDGSAKMCVTMVNEAGQVVAGDSVPETTVTVPTGESLSWHQDADPFVVEYPLTDTYNRPLDSDQFGTSDDLPQGDGYLDSHCLEWHGLPEDETVEYGEVEIEGPHADQVELVGYIQRAHEAWDTDIDPLEAAEPYEEAGGGWTYRPDGSHGQMVVVLQLDGDADIPVDDGDGADDGGNGDDGAGTADDSGSAADETGSEGDTVPGFGALGVLAAFGALLVGAIRRDG